MILHLEVYSRNIPSTVFPARGLLSSSHADNRIGGTTIDQYEKRITCIRMPKSSTAPFPLQFIERRVDFCRNDTLNVPFGPLLSQRQLNWWRTIQISICGTEERGTPFNGITEIETANPRAGKHARHRERQDACNNIAKQVRI